MAIFQPTNITPDMKGGAANGVIIIPSGVVTPTEAEISWSVNGNSKLTAYQIDFYQNTAESTLTGSTGKITVSPAFSAIAADGSTSRFTATVAWSLIAGAYAGTGGYQGKFKITQWWGSGANDYVEQRSLSVFEVTRNGALSILSVSGVGGDLTITGQYVRYSAFSFQALDWTRWEIFLGAANGEPEQDTGKVWGATEYVWSPNTLAPGTYLVRFTAGQANGSTLTATEWVSVLQNDLTPVTGLLSAICNREKSAVQISLTAEDYLSVSAESGATVYSIPGEQFFAVPWHFIWNGILTNGTLFSVECADGTTISAAYDTGTFTLSPVGTGGGNYQSHAGDEAYICFTTGYFTDGTSGGFQWLIYSAENQGNDNYKVSGFTQSPVVRVTLYDAVTTIQATVGFGTNNDGIRAGYEDETTGAIFEGPQAHVDAGQAVIRYLGTSQSERAIFRQEEYGENVTFIGVFEEEPSGWETVLYDYSAVNGKHYQYFVLENGEEGGNAAISYSGQASPCFWDWLLMEASLQGSGWAGSKNQSYKLVQAFRFSANVSTGSYTNRSTRSVQATFTPYPAVFRSTQNSRQGTLTGLIGTAKAGSYTDNNDTEAALRALSGSNNPLFLRDRRGHIMKVALAGEISLSVNDATATQEITASIPWVEIGPAEGSGIFDVEYIDNSEPEDEA